MNNEFVVAERERCISCVDAADDGAGEMPDEIYNYFEKLVRENNKEELANTLRMMVGLVKDEIKELIRGGQM